MKIKNIILVFIILLLACIKIQACSCTPITGKFIDKLKVYQFVGLVEIMSKDTIYNSNNKDIWYAFTTVKLIKQYSGKQLRDTIKIVDAKGYECFKGIYYQNIGDQRIIKGFIKNTTEYLRDYSDFSGDRNNEENELCVELFLCDENQVNVVDKNVLGYITKRRYNLWSKMGVFINKITFGYLGKKKRQNPYQTMELKSFEKKIKRHLF